MPLSHIVALGFLPHRDEWGRMNVVFCFFDTHYCVSIGRCAGDMYRLAVKWTEFAPRVVQVYPELFAEMYALILAAVDLQMPFTLIQSLVVSTTTSTYVSTPTRSFVSFVTPALAAGRSTRWSSACSMLPTGLLFFFFFFCSIGVAKVGNLSMTYPTKRPATTCRRRQPVVIHRSNCQWRFIIANDIFTDPCSFPNTVSKRTL